MVRTLMRLGLTLPIATHDAMKKLSYRRSADAGRAVTLSDLYAEAVAIVAGKIEAGEAVHFPVQPPKSVRPVSLRLPAETVDQINRHAACSSMSAIVAKGAEALLQSEE